MSIETTLELFAWKNSDSSPMPAAPMCGFCAGRRRECRSPRCIAPKKSPPRRISTGISDAARAYLGESPAPSRRGRCSVPVAGPCARRAIRMTNIGWTFSGDDVAKALGMERRHADQRFRGDCLRCRHISRPDDLIALGPDKPVTATRGRRHRGARHRLRRRRDAYPCERGRRRAGERSGGHASFAPTDETVEISILKTLSARFGRGCRSSASFPGQVL